MSTIEEKKNEKLNSENKDDNKSNWVAFAINVIQNFILTLFIGILGANFIFLTSSSSIFLDNVLPSQECNYFPPCNNQSQKGGDGGENYNENCETPKKSFSMKNLQALGIGGSGGWPYKHRSNRDSSSSVGFFQDFIDWAIDTIYDTYKFNRGVLKSWLAFFAKPIKNNSEGANTFMNSDTFQILFIAPLTLMASVLAFPSGFFVSLFSSFFNSESNFGVFWALFGLVFGWTWGLSSTISMVQFIQYLFLFMVLPLLSNLTAVKKILHCNIKTLALLFGALVCGSASVHLDNVTSYVMTGVYIILFIKSFL